MTELHICGVPCRTHCGQFHGKAVEPWKIFKENSDLVGLHFKQIPLVARMEGDLEDMES